jgi:hypothetical protein
MTYLQRLRNSLKDGALDVTCLRFAACTSTVLGQLPLQSLWAPILEFKIISVAGLWCLGVLLLNILCGQASILSLIVQRKTLTSVASEELSETLSFLFIFYSFQVYLLYLVSLLSAPRLLSVLKMTVLFDKEFRTDVRLGLRRIGLKALQTGVWWLECALSVAADDTTLASLEANPALREAYEDSSWIHIILGRNDSSFKAIRWAVGLHLILSEFGAGAGLNYLLILSQCLEDRLDILEEEILKQIKNPVRLTSASIVSREKTSHINLLDTEELTRRILGLNYLFKGLREAANFMLFAFMSITTVSVTLFVFCSFAYAERLMQRGGAIFAVTLVFVLGINVFKLLLLSNCGESLKEKVSLVQVSSNFVLRYSLGVMCSPDRDS